MFLLQRFSLIIILIQRRVFKNLLSRVGSVASSHNHSPRVSNASSKNSQNPSLDYTTSILSIGSIPTQQTIIKTCNTIVISSIPSMFSTSVITIIPTTVSNSLIVSIPTTASDSLIPTTASTYTKSNIYTNLMLLIILLYIVLIYSYCSQHT